LVVDDQFENRDWLMKLLISVGFSVRDADSGESAIGSWEEWDPHLILMDVHMPGVDGIEATRRIKGDPRGVETKILVLTASAMDHDRRSIAESGADAFVAKPCREDELLEKMRVLLKIDYAYEEPSGANEGSAFAPSASIVENLRQLPPEIIEELLNATSNGEKGLLDELILKVREREGAGSADALQHLADSYEYDTLTRLLEEACQS
jgi:CheY-like chemotaxis protein